LKEYYDTRAPEYDDWYLGRRGFAERNRPGWDDELAALIALIEGLPAKRTLDVACGTGFLTRHLQGDVTGLDQSARMLAIAAERRPDATFVQGDGLDLPFEDRAFERLFTGHFYGHLEEDARVRFLAEARRVSSELVVVDASRAHSPVAEDVQERVLNDGSQWTVYKRFFDPDELAAELGGGGGETLFAGIWFVVVRA
jgi:ubiquinone/menaquinone biosynthesis C-methylase UbiE